MSVNQPNSRYRHMYLVARLDASLSLADAWTCVSAWFTESLACAEAERLNRISPGVPLSCSVEMTRLKEAIPADPPMNARVFAAQNSPSMKYGHLYLIIRFDSYVDGHKDWACVSAWFTESLACAEAERLNRLKPDGSSGYSVQITRLKEALPTTDPPKNAVVSMVEVDPKFRTLD